MDETDTNPSDERSGPGATLEEVGAASGGEGELPSAPDPLGASAITADAERDRAFVPDVVSWGRVAIGLVVIGALHSVLVFGLFELAFFRGPVATIAWGFLPYLLGGAVLGLTSRGVAGNLVEPFYAAVVPALVFPFVVEMIRVQSTDPPEIAQAMARVQWLAVLAPVLAYVLVALFACWLAERIAGRGIRRGDEAARSNSKV